MADRIERTDVVIVGCGPGGAVLAYLLARSGVDVTLLERAATFEREYRGFGWNPGVIRLFDEMDVLDDVLNLAHETITDGTFSLYGEEVTVLDFELLETDYPYALMMEQPALLECLVGHAGRYDGFSFHSATTVTELTYDASSSVHGVLAHDRTSNQEVQFEARVVVGADGRYSSVRTSAHIDPGLFESPVDLIWFKLPHGAVASRTEGRIDRNGILMYFGLGGGELQIGYLIQKGEWPTIKKAGFGAFEARIAAIDPEVASAIHTYLDGFHEMTLLDISPGLANTWTRDGLVLLGDAAHVASPVGAQGNPLAVEDAVVVHDVLVNALSGSSGSISQQVLSEFETRRRPPVKRVISLQRRAADNFALWVKYGNYVPPWLVKGSATVFGWAVPRSRFAQQLVEAFALGDQTVSVDRSHFTD